ncbi:hypothetical protein RFI_33416, partial [Reticulomyxa filosa]
GEENRKCAKHYFKQTNNLFLLISAVLTVRPNIEVVNIVNRTFEKSVELAKRFESICPNKEKRVKFNPVKCTDKTSKQTKDAPEEVLLEYDDACVRDADVICTATMSAHPLFDGKLLKPN